MKLNSSVWIWSAFRMYFNETNGNSKLQQINDMNGKYYN